jgi:hypothetical protein
MRIIFLLAFVLLLVAAPIYALNSLIMPQLQSAKQFYMQEDAVANNVARLQD